MRIVLISIDLTAPGVEAEPIYTAIKAQGRWWHYMKWVWLVHTAKSVQDVSSAIQPHISGKGRMLVMELRRPYHGLLPKAAWEWIAARVNQKSDQ
jgi:hypothetical protein